MSFFVKVWRCTDGVPPPCSGQHDIGPGEKGRTLISTMERFSAGTGDIVTPNWVVPGHGGGIVSGGGSPEHGLPILPASSTG